MGEGSVQGAYRFGGISGGACSISDSIGLDGFGAKAYGDSQGAAVSGLRATLFKRSIIDLRNYLPDFLQDRAEKRCYA